ncbi:MAG: transcription elongation factor GreA [Lachnospiraceae bacterium]|nr:transcription elongation factor GreA [Lachnospiraceae bacterium]
MHDRLTESDIRKMEEEIEYRKLTLRHELLDDVKEARAHGDLSENFEYHAAKRAKNKNESRIRYLERMIRTADIIEDDSADDEVGMNNLVTVIFDDDGTEETYKIVTSVRSDSLNNLITIESPLGKALLKHKVGDKVKVTVNDSVSYFVTIKNIENNKDDADDKLRGY